MIFLAVFMKEKDGRYSVSVPLLPGCFSQGDTFEDAKRNIEEAINLYLEDEDFSDDFDEETQIVAPIDVSVK